jgi:hypothetical protein
MTSVIRGDGGDPCKASNVGLGRTSVLGRRWVSVPRIEGAFKGKRG